MATAAPPFHYGTRVFLDCTDLSAHKLEWEQRLSCRVSERRLSPRDAVWNLTPSSESLKRPDEGQVPSGSLELERLIQARVPSVGFLARDPEAVSTLRLTALEVPNCFQGTASNWKLARLAALENRYASIWQSVSSQFLPKRSTYFAPALVLQLDVLPGASALRPRLQTRSQKEHIEAALASKQCSMSAHTVHPRLDVRLRTPPASRVIPSPKAEAEPLPSLTRTECDTRVAATDNNNNNSSSSSSASVLHAGGVHDSASPFLESTSSASVLRAGGAHHSAAPFLEKAAHMPASSVLAQPTDTAVAERTSSPGHVCIHFAVQCDDSVLQQMEAAANHLSLCMTGNMMELGSWNLNVARKLEFSVQRRTFYLTVALFSTGALTSESIRYVYFFLDDRLGDRRATRVIFEVPAYSVQRTGAASITTAESILRHSSTDNAWLDAFRPRVRSVSRSSASKPVRVHDYIEAVQDAGTLIKLRVNIERPVAPAQPEHLIKKVYATGDVYQLGLWTQPGLVALQRAASEPDTWELSIVRPPWDDVEYIYAIESEAEDAIQYEHRPTRFRRLCDETTCLNHTMVCEDIVSPPSTATTPTLISLSVNPAVLVGPFLSATQLQTTLVSLVAASTDRSLGLVIVFLPHERVHCTNPAEREQLQVSATRLGIRLLLVPLPSNRLLMTAEWPGDGSLAAETGTDQGALLKAVATAEAVLQRGSAVYFTSAGSYRVLATVLAVLSQRAVSTDREAPRERLYEMLECIRRETGLIGLPNYALWRLLLNVAP